MYTVLTVGIGLALMVAVVWCGRRLATLAAAVEDPVSELAADVAESEPTRGTLRLTAPAWYQLYKQYPHTANHLRTLGYTTLEMVRTDRRFALQVPGTQGTVPDVARHELHRQVNTTQLAIIFDGDPETVFKPFPGNRTPITSDMLQVGGIPGCRLMCDAVMLGGGPRQGPRSIRVLSRESHHVRLGSCGGGSCRTLTKDVAELASFSPGMVWLTELSQSAAPAG